MNRSRLFGLVEIVADVLDSTGMRTLRLEGKGKAYIVFYKPSVGAWGFKIEPTIRIPNKMAELLYLKGWPYED